MAEKPYWFPTLCDKEYCKRLREDYPDQAKGMSDEELVEHYNDGAKYSTTWDHVGDAYEEYEPLADSFLDLLSGVKTVLAMGALEVCGKLGHLTKERLEKMVNKAENTV